MKTKDAEALGRQIQRHYYKTLHNDKVQQSSSLAPLQTVQQSVTSA